MSYPVIYLIIFIIVNGEQKKKQIAMMNVMDAGIQNMWADCRPRSIYTNAVSTRI